MGCGDEVLATRKVEIAGISAAPSGVWMTQIARNAAEAGVLSLGIVDEARIAAEIELDPIGQGP